MSRPPPGGADTMILTVRLGSRPVAWACATACAAPSVAAATKTRKILRIDRPRGLPTTATSGYVPGDELSWSAGRLAAGEGGNDEDRANRRDPAKARPRASRRHIPRPHHGGRRAGRARQFPALVRPDGRRFQLAAPPAQFRADPLPARRRARLRSRRQARRRHGRLFPGGGLLRPPEPGP